jgi:hypothetical protein
LNLKLLRLWSALLALSLCGVALSSAGAAQAGSVPVEADRVPGRMIVGLRRGLTLSASAIAARLSAQLGPAVHTIEALAGDALALSVDPAGVDQLIARLSANPQVAYAEPDYRLHLARTPNDPRYNEQWALPQISAPAAWERSTGTTVRIAVVDTGVYAEHPELAGRVLPGRDFVYDDDDAADDNGHGTFIAGVIGAAGDDGVGVAGVCWSCQILPVKVMDAEGNGGASDVAQGIRWAVDQGAQVINISVGGPRNPTVLRDAIAYAESRGALVVGAAGNEALDGNPIEYPSAYASVLAVGATTRDDRHAVFSNYGEQLDLAAPGVAITSTTWTPGAAASYATADGTSMATPFVAGVAGLLLSVNPALTAEQLRQLLLASADDVAAPGWDVYTGAGRVNAQRALDAAAASSADDPGRLFPETGKTLTGEFRRFWEQNGGLPIFGLPISDQREEQTPEGRFVVQYFERNRFELHPENPPGAQVLLGRLGETGLVQQGIDWQATPPSAPQPGCQYFAVTGRNVCEPFLSYWRTHGLLDPHSSLEQRSLALFGLPLTEPRVETNAAGDTVLTQWFERARFEDHGAQGVLLGLLGSELSPLPKGPQVPQPPICPDVPPAVDADLADDPCAPVGKTISATVRGFTPGEPIASWLTGPDGVTRPGVDALAADEQGQAQLGLPTTGLTAGQWLWVFQGTTSRHQALIVVQVY